MLLKFFHFVPTCVHLCPRKNYYKIKPTTYVMGLIPQLFFPVLQTRYDGPFLVIGDRRQDMEIARRNGLRAIGCLYGYGSPEELGEADWLAGSPKELPTVLESVFPSDDGNETR